MSAILIFLIKIYHWVISPLIHALCGPGCGCRFEPSCSVYAMEAIRQHGSFGGLWLAIRRIGRCHPWGSCGYDPVPKAREARFPWKQKQDSDFQNMKHSPSNSGSPVC